MSDFLKEAIDELTENEEERKQIIRNILNDADAAAEGKIKSYSLEEVFDE